MGIAGKTHIGLVRDKNEDCFAIFEDIGVFLVADGIGGHAHGEVASQMAVDSFLKSYRQNLNTPIIDRIKSGFFQANQAVHGYQEERATGHLMGTTLTVACLQDNDLYIGHVGDSRAYISRFQDEIKQITQDHTFYAELAKHDPVTLDHMTSGTIRLQRDYLAKAIGPEAEVDPQILRVSLLEEDRVLLATDGLYRYFDSPGLLKILYSSSSPPDLLNLLEKQALDSGGRDNLTSIIYIHERR